MKELIVKPSFLSKITVNSEYLEKQLLELSIKMDRHGIPVNRSSITSTNTTITIPFS